MGFFSVMIGITFDTEVSQVGGCYKAKCPEMGLEVSGRTKEEAIENLMKRTKRILDYFMSDVKELT